MRPYIICHMLSSVDGRIRTDQWPPFAGIENYERTGRSEKADAWMCGRTTMQQHYATGLPELPEVLTGSISEVHIADTTADSFAIALDPQGKLGWSSADLDGDHLITILTRRVSDAYLQYLQNNGVSYIIGGNEEIDLDFVLSKLYELFGIKKILLEGGGRINGSFHNAGLIDEFHLLYHPIADGSTGPTLLDTGSPETSTVPFRQLKLIGLERLENDILYMKYFVVK